MTGVSEDGGNCLRGEGCSLRSCRTLGYSRVSGQRLARQGQIREEATEIDLQRRQQGFEHCLSKATERPGGSGGEGATIFCSASSERRPDVEHVACLVRARTAPHEHARENEPLLADTLTASCMHVWELAPDPLCRHLNDAG